MLLGLRSFFAFLLVISLTACSSAPERKVHIPQNCTQNIQDPELAESLGMKIIRSTLQGPVILASYFLTGLGYTADVVIEITEGIAVPVLICSPIIVAEVAAKENGHLSLRCINEIGGHFYKKLDIVSKSLGKETYEVTRGWRCPNLDSIGRTMRQVASCHYQNKQYQKARYQVEAITNDKDLYNCLSSEEQNEVQKLLQKFKS